MYARAPFGLKLGFDTSSMYYVLSAQALLSAKFSDTQRLVRQHLLEPSYTFVI